jgi:predicted nuclease with TOPRIM domain
MSQRLAALESQLTSAFEQTSQSLARYGHPMHTSSEVDEEDNYNDDDEYEEKHENDTSLTEELESCYAEIERLRHDKVRLMKSLSAVYEDLYSIRASVDHLQLQVSADKLKVSNSIHHASVQTQIVLGVDDDDPKEGNDLMGQCGLSTRDEYVRHCRHVSVALLDVESALKSLNAGGVVTTADTAPWSPWLPELAREIVQLSNRMSSMLS